MTITRRDRTAARVPPSRHLVPLAGGWALWRSVGVRGAGFPMALLSALSAEPVAAAADRGDLDTFRVEFDRAVGRLGATVRDLAARPDLREAMAWQNRHALATGVDALLRHDPATGHRNSRHKDREALIVRYVHRYCAKNDTIGFFGPVGWASVDDGEGVRVVPSPVRLAARTVHLEGWALAAIMAPHAEALRPWLAPRRMPYLTVDGTVLRAPLAPPVRLDEAAAVVLAACDGVRDATEVATIVLGEGRTGLRTAQDVYDVLADLRAHGRLVWDVEAAPGDLRPEDTIRRAVMRVTDDGVRASAVKTLDELVAARDALAAAAGDAERVAGAMADLEATFTRLSGVEPTRRHGSMYAGRTVAYEECLRGATIHIGRSTMDNMADALALVLDSARWFTGAAAALVRRGFADAYQQRVAELRTEAVPLADVWLLAGDVVFTPPPQLLTTLTRAVQRRWAQVLGLPSDGRRIQLRAADLRDKVRAAFPPGPPGWPTAVHHSPDLMIAGTRWVLGELHAGVNTVRYAAMVNHHHAPEELRAAMASDLRRGLVFPAQSREGGGLAARLGNALTNDKDIRFVYARDGVGHDPARGVTVAECELVDSPTGLRVRRRGGGLDVDLMEVLGDLVAGSLAQHFSLVAPARHTPRVTIDALVVNRESWTFTPAEVPFAVVKDEADRYLAARAWVAEHGLPRHVFVRCTGERKPMYADLTGLASVDLLARSVRQARRAAGEEAKVRVVEMLPAPDELWLTDAEGQRYTAELRLVAVDRERG